MIRSFRRGTPVDFRARRGLRVLGLEEREELRVAVVGRLPRDRLAPEAGEGLRLVGFLRRVGDRGGMPVGRQTPLDAEIAVCLFEDASTAVRNATMRSLLERGADSNDLRSLEDLVGHLERVPDEGWEGEIASERGLRLPGAGAARRRSRRREVRADR